MRFKTGALVGAAMTLALAGCSQPAANTTANAASGAADATAGAAASAAGAASNAAQTAAAGATDHGGVVSPPTSPENDAINADANRNDTTLAKGSNSFTEGQARGRIENAGYTDVKGLTKTEGGLWTGTAMKNGKTAKVSLDFKGAVSTK